PTKAALFRHALDVATVGDEAPVRVADRPEIRATLSQPDPRAAIRQSIDYLVALLERAGDLIMVSVEAAGADADMAVAADAGAQATHRVWLALTETLHRQGPRKPGPDPVGDADILYALGSPHVHQL